jgi:hypothetical protein
MSSCISVWMTCSSSRDPPQIHITHARRRADRYVPILPALADELRTDCRLQGFLFERHRHTRYSTRMVQSIVKDCPREAGIAKRNLPASTPTFCGHLYLIPNRSPSIKCRNSWAIIFRARRSMPGRACGPSATTRFGHREAGGSRSCLIRLLCQIFGLR